MAGGSQKVTVLGAMIAGHDYWWYYRDVFSRDYCRVWYESGRRLGYDMRLATDTRKAAPWDWVVSFPRQPVWHPFFIRWLWYEQMLKKVTSKYVAITDVSDVCFSV